MVRFGYAVASAMSSWPAEPPSWVIVSDSDFANAYVQGTHVDDGSIARRLPVNRIQDDRLGLEQILDISHELNKVSLPPPLLLPLTIILNKIPRIIVLAPNATRMAEAKRRLLLHSANLLFTNREPPQRLGQQHHRRRRLVEHHLHQRLQPGVLGQRRRARRVLHACGGGLRARKVPHRHCVVEGALHHLHRERSVFGNLLVRRGAVHGHGAPEVELVENIESCDVWHSLSPCQHKVSH